MDAEAGYCYGCRTYWYAGDYCNYAVHNNESEGLCPCVSCIVKSMCDQDCDLFSKWTDTEGAEEELHKSLLLKMADFYKKHLK